MKSEILKAISPNKNTLYVFIGNDLREDDGAGPYIAKKIKNDRIKIMDAGSVFENRVSEIIELKPDKLVIIDAAFFGGKPGDMQILDEKNLKSYKMFSTHTLPLNIFLELIRDEIKNIEIVILGIQPKSMDYKEGISKEVQESCDNIVNYLNSIS
ncbi:MAG: hydrogenase maturation peptidase HycI [Elusimicrobiales bacterium]|nr:hydrogenase maturation peptidase HycI [Elusimicrobiales bacterium]HOL61818.1 hydrogenase maturation peptidase HycI [Elusimicrobiales bacterium]HPO94600.1 hydrogenase maturation peptidase HycI [Elusimicrobiales bacterium]